MNEKVIWDFFMSKLNNPFGVAGLMGNLYVESHLEPTYLQSSYARKLGMSGAEYTDAVNYNRYLNFSNDSAGYGLAQWTYSARKEALLNYAKTAGFSVGDLNMQLNFLWSELQKYTTVVNTLKSAKSVHEASDIVALKYEKPKDTSTKALQNRATFGRQYYDTFTQTDKKHIIVTTDNVNIRNGNGKDYSRLGQAKLNSIFEWVATSENNWHAIVYKKQVAWISGEFSRVSE